MGPQYYGNEMLWTSLNGSKQLWPGVIGLSYLFSQTFIFFEANYFWQWFLQVFSHSTSSQWWECGSFRKKQWGTMQHSTFRWRSVIHPNFCKLFSHSTSSQWWECGSLRIQRWGTTQHSTFRWRSVIHPNFCRWTTHSTSSQWWECGSLRIQPLRTMQHSISEILAWALDFCKCQSSVYLRF